MYNARYKMLKKFELTEDESFDEKINNAIRDNDPCMLQEQLGISLEKAAEICEEIRLYGKISLRNLKTIMFARDRKVLDIKIDKVTPVELASEKLEPEFEFFNNSMLDQNDSAVKVEGRNSEGKRVVLYYYPGNLIKHEYDINRQMRIYNEQGDIEALQEQIIFAGGLVGSPISAVAAYRYDENGNKKFGLYEDEYYGGRYFEYDEDRKMRYLLTEGEIRHVNRDMMERLSRAFSTTRSDFINLDNSSLEDNLKLFSGENYKEIKIDRVNRDER